MRHCTTRQTPRQNCLMEERSGVWSGWHETDAGDLHDLADDDPMLFEAAAVAGVVARVAAS